MTALDHIRRIVVLHRCRQSLSGPNSDELGDFEWAEMTTAPSGREIWFGADILAVVADLADILPRDDQSVGGEEWYRWVKRCVAEALDRNNPSTSPDDAASEILAFVKNALDQRKIEKGEYEFAFGCKLFSEFAPPPFCIGPVRFETRQDWLERKVTEGAISDRSRHRILCAWKGDMPHDHLSGAAYHKENSILSISNDAEFICSVNTKGMTHEFSRPKALTTARLALTAIALFWQSPSAALQKMNLTEDRIVRILHQLTFQEGQIASYGGRKSHFPGGQGLTADQWRMLERSLARHWQIIGHLLYSIVDNATRPQRPKITHALTHALLWFHHGCQEEEAVMAVTSFAAALDCLASGESRNGIKDLIKAQLGVDADSSPWTRGGQTAGEAIEEIYDHGRTAMIHGRKDQRNKRDSNPFRDWAPVRRRAEALVRCCLLTCIEWTAQHPDIDDPARWRKV